MQRTSTIWALGALAVMIGVAATQSLALADPGLLLIAHGSRSAEWNKPVLDFGRQVAQEAKKSGRFKAVRTAMLEATKPDIPTAVAELEAEGCDRIIAVPLFVAPTSHTHFDLPAVLGIYSSPRTRAVLAEEGAQAARPKVPITVTQTMSEGQVLPKYALDQVRKLSKSPKEEALVILAHGDPEHQLLADRLMRRVTTYCCGEAGIGYGDWAFIGIGQEYLTHAVPAIRTALEHKKRVLVVGLYVSFSAAKIHRRVVAMHQRDKEFDPFRGKEVVLSDEAIIGHPDLLRWVLDAAQGGISWVPAQEPPTSNGGPRESAARLQRASR